jgi:hypothetical protein
MERWKVSEPYQANFSLRGIIDRNPLPTISNEGVSLNRINSVYLKVMFH